MTKAATVRVSSRGQMSLPASARHRWGIGDGGVVTVLDLDGSLLVVPGSPESLRRDVHKALSGGRYESAVAALDDSDLAND